MQKGGSSSKGYQNQRSVTFQTYKNIDTNMRMFILARLLTYKFIPPFNEMYIKLQQQHKRSQTDSLILDVMFDDLQGETYRVDNTGKNLTSGRKVTQDYQKGAIVTQALYQGLL